MMTHKQACEIIVICEGSCMQIKCLDCPFHKLYARPNNPQDNGCLLYDNNSGADRVMLSAAKKYLLDIEFEERVLNE